MNDQTQFSAKVSWKTLVTNVSLFSDETVENPAEFIVKVSPVDINDPGADTFLLKVGHYLSDIANNVYRVIEVDVDTVKGKIKIKDIFRCGVGPQPNRYGKIFESPYIGIPSFLPPTKENALLWKYSNIANVKWHPEGLLFAYSKADGEIPERIMHSQGDFVLHYWDHTKESVYDEIPVLPPVDILDPTLGTPVFIVPDQLDQTDLVVQSTRYKGIGRIKFQATCPNALSVIYSIDEASLLAGNTINSATGVVEFALDWLGITTVTATFKGINNTEAIITQDIETIAYDENTVISINAQTFQTDPKPFYRKWFIQEEWFDIKTDFTHYIYAKLPIYDDLQGNVIITSELFNETIIENHLMVLMGVLHSKDAGRGLIMLWGGSGAVPQKPSGGPTTPPVQTRYTIISETCLLDGNGNRTGQQHVQKQKEQYDTETQTWVPVGEVLNETITNLSACPPPAPDPYRVATYTGQTWDANGAVDYPFAYSMTVKCAAVPGNNYVFISSPTALGKPTIKNTMSIDISDQFESIGSDNKTGYQPNTVWKKSTLHSTNKVTTYYLTM